MKKYVYLVVTFIIACGITICPAVGELSNSQESITLQSLIPCLLFFLVCVSLLVVFIQLTGLCKEDKEDKDDEEEETSL